MEQGIFSRIAEYLSDKRRKARWQKVVSIMGALVVFVTTYALILPAITMEGRNPKIEAELQKTDPGSTLSIEVTAKADEDKERTVFYLSTSGANAGLHPDYIFDDLGVTKITDRSGKLLELTREVESDGKVNYWFTLEKGETSDFPLTFNNGIGVPTTTTWTEVVENTPEEPVSPEVTEADPVVQDLGEVQEGEGTEENNVTDLDEASEEPSEAEEVPEEKSETTITKSKVTFEGGDAGAEGSLAIKAGSGDSVESAAEDAGKSTAIDLTWKEESEVSSESSSTSEGDEGSSAAESEGNDESSSAVMGIMPMALDTTPVATGTWEGFSWVIYRDLAAPTELTMTLTGSGKLNGVSGGNWGAHLTNGAHIVSYEVHGATEIADNAFFNQDKVKSIVFDGPLTTVGDDAFTKCKALENLVLPDSVTTLGMRVFSECESLESFDIPSGVTTIPLRSFEFCTSLKSIVIPDGVTDIQLSAFGDCTSLASVTFPTSGSLTDIKTDAFRNCTSLKKMTIPEGITQLNAIADGCNLDLLTLPSTLTTNSAGGKNGTKAYAINGSNSRFTIIDGILYQNAYQDPGRYYLSGYPAKSTRTEFTLPSYVTMTLQNAFYRAENLKKLTIPSLGTSNNYFPYQCFNLEEINIEPGTYFSTYSSEFENCSKLKSIVIPDGAITSITNSMFRGCTSLEEFVIPSTVTTIGENAFTNCSLLKELVIPESVNSIGFRAFNHCTSLKSITMTPKSSLSMSTGFATGDMNFKLIISDETVNINSGLNSLAQYANEIIFPKNKALYIYKDAFKDCGEPLSSIGAAGYIVGESGELYAHENVYAKKLMLVYCPPGITDLTVSVVKRKVYETDLDLTTYYVTSVGSNVLKKATSLQSINFTDTNTLAGMGSYALANCPTLTKVNGETTVEAARLTFLAALRYVDSRTFYNTGLIGAIGSGSFGDDMDGKKSINHSADGSSTLNVSVTLPSDAEGWKNKSGSTDIGGYHLLTGQAETVTVSVGNTSATNNYTYKVYFQLTDGSGALSRLPGSTEVINGQYVSFDKSTKDANTIVASVRPAIGATVSFDVTAIYSSGLAGGGLRVWTEIVTNEHANDAMIHRGTDDILSFWGTYPPDYTLKKSTATEPITIVAVSKTKGQMASELTWLIELNREETIPDYGKDIVASVEYEDVITLPTGMSWSSDILAAIKSGDIELKLTNSNGTRASFYFFHDGVQFLSLDGALSASNNSIVINPRLEWDTSKNAVVLRWEVTNRYDGYDYGSAQANLKFGKSAFEVDLAKYNAASGAKEVKNDISADIYYNYYENVRKKTASAKRPLQMAGADFKFSKVMLSGGEMMGRATDYKLTIYNEGSTDFTVSKSGVYTLVDELGEEAYVKAEDMERMFKEEFGADLTVVISNAETADWKAVTGAEGGTAWLNVSNTGASQLTNAKLNQTITVSRNGATGYKAVVTSGGTYTDTTVYGALKKAGYAPTRSAKYTFKWALNASGVTLKLTPGEHREFNVYSTIKDTFQLMSQDWICEYPIMTASIITLRNNAYVLEPGNGAYYKSDGVVTNVDSIDARVTKDGYLDGFDFTNEDQEDVLFKDEDIIDYALNFYHLNTVDGAYENLPMVDNLYGSQYLMVPVNDNPQLASKGLRVVDGHYVLTAGTYTNVKVGLTNEDQLMTAASIVVTVNTNQKQPIPGLEDPVEYVGNHTVIKWYFPNLPDGGYLLQLNYKAIVDFDLVGDYGTYGIGNGVWMNDKDKRFGAPYNARIYDFLWRGGTILDFEKHIVLEKGTNPSLDVIDEDDFLAIDKGDSVLYRLKLRNSRDYPYYVNGSEIADALPDTYGAFNWTKGSNIKFVGYTSTHPSTQITGLTNASWRIDNPTTADEVKQGRYFIRWDDNTKINFVEGDAAVYIYFTVDFPSSDSVWSSYKTKVGSTILENTFLVYNFPNSVHHRIKETGAARLQKGVYNTYVTSLGNTSNTKIFDDRLHFSNSASTAHSFNADHRAVTYYVTLYNGESKRLYLTDMYDKLPTGFTPSKISNFAGQAEQTVGINEPIDILGTNMAKAKIIDVENKADTYDYRTVSVEMVYDKRYPEYVKFSFDGVAANYSDAIKYDEYFGKYYLDQGEAITFTYVCDIGLVSETEDIANNTITMPYFDPTNGGLNILGEPDLIITGHQDENNTTANDGGCNMYTADQVNRFYGISDEGGDEQWLVSDVELIRGKIIPGVTKTTEYYRVSEDPSQIPYEISAGYKDYIDWGITLHNNGTAAMYNYTFTDVMPYPYVFTGKIEMKTYDAFGQKNKATDVILGARRESGGKKYIGEFEINGDWKQVAGDSGVYVKFSTDAQGNEILSMRFERYDHNIQEHGGYAEIKLSSYNPTEIAKNATYINRATLTPNAQEFENVAQGSMVRGDDGEPESVTAVSPVLVSSGYATRSDKRVTEVANPSNTAVSNATTISDPTVLNYITLPTAASEFTYTLCVKNDSKKAMTKFVLIDNLPEVGDHFTFNKDMPRNSEFDVSLSDTPNFKVAIMNGDTVLKNLVLGTDYTLQYSTKTEFVESDWDGTSSWNGTAATARSFRVIINDPAATLIPVNATIKINFNAKISSAAETEAIAWNTFGYHYNVLDVVEYLEAMPLEVGVKIPGSPTLEKRLVDSNGNAAKAEEEETFNFIVYKGAKINNFTTKEKLIEDITTAGYLYKEITLKVPAGASTSGKNALSFADFWTDGSTYTIVELPLADDDYLYKRIGDSTASNGYSFTYNKNLTLSIVCENEANTPPPETLDWSILLKKTDGMTDEKLEGAEFALYTKTEADKMTDATYDNLTTVKPDKVLVIGEAPAAETWYLMSVKATDDKGEIKWDKLPDESYYLVEVKAPDGYTLITGGQKVYAPTDDTKLITVEVENFSTYVLPESGGIGTTMFTIGGILLMLAAVLLYKRNLFRKGGKANS